MYDDQFRSFLLNQTAPRLKVGILGIHAQDLCFGRRRVAGSEVLAPKARHLVLDNGSSSPVEGFKARCLSHASPRVDETGKVDVQEFML